MIIILEGENKTGKSTLAKKLVNDFNFTYVKCSQPEKDPYIEYQEKLRQGYDDIVFDRFWLGEHVYGKLYRGKSKLNEEQDRNIQLKMMALNSILIYCYDTEKNIAKRFKQEGEEFANIDKIKDTLNLFKNNLLNVNIPIFKHKMKTDRDLTKLNRLEKIINQFKDKFSINKDSVIGNLNRPKFLFVGDSRNIKQPLYEVGQPFDFGPSSRYLFSQVKKANINLNDIAIINANDISKEELKYLILIILPKNVIALGDEAAAALDEINEIYDYSYHPNYLNRFRHYKNDLSKILKKYDNK